MRFAHYIRPTRHTFIQHLNGRDVIVPTINRPASVAVGASAGVSPATVAQMIEADNVRDDARDDAQDIALEYHFERENW